MLLWCLPIVSSLYRMYILDVNVGLVRPSRHQSDRQLVYMEFLTFVNCHVCVSVSVYLRGQPIKDYHTVSDRLSYDMLKTLKFPERLEEKNNSNGSEPAQKTTSYHSVINYFLGILQRIRTQIISKLSMI
jgi:hypothetical protein